MGKRHKCQQNVQTYKISTDTTHITKPLAQRPKGRYIRTNILIKIFKILKEPFFDLRIEAGKVLVNSNLYKLHFFVVVIKKMARNTLPDTNNSFINENSAFSECQTTV